MMSVQANEIKLRVHGVVPAGVKLLERLHAGQKQIRGHRVGHQFRDFPNGGILDLQPGQLHERVSVVLGSRNEVERVTAYHREAG